MTAAVFAIPDWLTSDSDVSRRGRYQLTSSWRFV
jgi:hypothetical protein